MRHFPINTLRTLALSAALCAGSLPLMAASVGQPAPDLALGSSTGAASLAALKGKVVYVDFWASWCAPCRKSFPWMNDMQAKYGAQGFQIVAINLDAKRADADKFLAEVPAKFTVAFDDKGNSAKQFGVKGMPTSVLIGPDGKVIDVHQGFNDGDRAKLEAKFAAALGRGGK